MQKVEDKKNECYLCQQNQRKFLLAFSFAIDEEGHNSDNYKII